MNIEDLDKEILKLEADWQIYHRDSKNNRMPDMIKLAKLRVIRRKFD
jgi:hypothetical protein